MPPGTSAAASQPTLSHPSRAGSYHWYGWRSVDWEAVPDVPGGTVTFRYRGQERG